MDSRRSATATVRFAARRGQDPALLAARLDRVLLQRAWKVCGTFARAVAAGKGEVYRRYLPAELDLVRRLLADRPADRAFEGILGSRGESAKLLRVPGIRDSSVG